MSAAYVVRSKYKSGGHEMHTEFRLVTPAADPRIDTLGKTQAELHEIEGGRLDGKSDVILPTLEDLARLGRIAQALLDGREPSAKNYDYKEPDN